MNIYSYREYRKSAHISKCLYKQISNLKLMQIEKGREFSQGIDMN